MLFFQVDCECQEVVTVVVENEEVWRASVVSAGAAVPLSNLWYQHQREQDFDTRTTEKICNVRCQETDDYVQS